MSILSNRKFVPALLALAIGAAIPLFAQTTQPTDAPAAAPALHFAKQPDVIALMDLKKIEPNLSDADLAKYETDLVGRTKDFVTDLKLTDKEKEAHMKESVIAFYRALRGWHFLHDAEYNKVKNDFQEPSPSRSSRPRKRSSPSTKPSSTTSRHFSLQKMSGRSKIGCATTGR